MSKGVIKKCYIELIKKPIFFYVIVSILNKIS